MRATLSPGPPFPVQLHEDAVIEGLEKMCDPDKDAGEWLTKIDIVEEGDQLKLVDMDGVSVSACACVCVCVCACVCVCV